MKSAELRRMDRLRQVMRLSARGKGMAASIVETFRDSPAWREREAVRSILLGRSVEESTRLMTGAKGHGDELLSFLVEQAKLDAPEASRRAEKLSALFERWVRAEQERLVDRRIMETRSLMVSAVVGGVTAMVASLAPVLSSFQLALTQQVPPPPSVQYLGILFVIPSSFFLGLFFSPMRAVLNLAVATAAFALTVYLFAPLVAPV
ncbi:MAG: hypothetical protein JRN09_06750 [Nitrososphaerota archaeon]|nr:hypothetical protein [Nitrososphaerota archaeon]